MAWNPDVNAQDKEGFTALHLAVRSVEELESTRPIRALLMKGANPNIRDNQGKLPIDYVENFSNDDIKPEIRNILKAKQSYIQTSANANKYKHKKKRT